MRSLAVASGAIAGSVGSVVLCGWAFHVVPLERLLPGLATMKANTALGMLLGGVGLVARGVRQGPVARRVAVGLAVAVVLLASLTLLESVAGFDLRIDQLLVHDLATAAAKHPGRPSPATALSLLCVGIALAALDRVPRLSQCAAMVSLSLGTLALLGYAYGFNALYHVSAFSLMALHTAAVLALLSAGTLLARPLLCVPSLFVSRSRGGHLARRLMPATVALPLVIGWACLVGRNSGLYATEFGFALFALSSIATFAALVWVNASALEGADARRERVEADRDGLLVRERAARQASEEALAARDQLLSVVSHELRTPLQPVALIAADLTARSDVPEDARQDLTIVGQQIAAEVQLIDDLLDVVRLRQAKVAAGHDRLDPAAIVGGAVKGFARPFADKGVTLTFDPPPAGAAVVGDRGRLQQVVRNVLSNALKFTPAGGSVRVECAVDGGRFSTTVSDTGIGIPAGAIDRIFIEFEQADASMTRSFGGLGLGLSISRRLAELHGGTLTATSDGPGRGARFRFDLPLAAAVPATPAAPQRPAVGGRRVLLVEDSPMTLAILSRLLVAKGYRVTPAASAREALAAVDRQGEGPFDVLVSDIGLPDLSGWDLMEKLGGRVPPRAIAVSGFVADADRRRSLATGFSEHLAKPIDLARLLAAIEAPARLPRSA